MAARTSHPILSAASSFDALTPVGSDAEYDEARARDRAARAPIDAAADRFIHTPGPAEIAREIADARLLHGDRTFAAGLGGLTIVMVGILAATVLRQFGIC